jgi:hypothetical protein
MAAQPEQTVTSDTPQGTNAGTDAATLPLVQSQATPYTPTRRTGRITGFIEGPGGAAFGVGTRLDPPSRIAPPPVETGVGANDDNPQADNIDTTNAKSYQDVINEWSVKPRANILDKYPSYTWQASVYMMTPEQANAYNKDPRHRPNGYNLLFQSGGAAQGTSDKPLGAIAGSAWALNQNTSNRNPFFTEDFYIEDITFKTIAAGKGNKTAHSSAELKFVVVEPSNISLIDRLAKAAADLTPMTSTGIPNYASASYLMIITFWAQDAQGNIVQVGEQSATNARGALVEKYIPFTVRSISYSITNSLVKYEWDCAPTGLQIGATTRWGTVRSTVELRGATVDDMLNGNPTVPYNEDVPGPNTKQELDAYLSQPTTGTLAGIFDTRGLPNGLYEAGIVQRQRTYVPPKSNVSADNQGLMSYMNAQEKQDVTNNLKNVPNQYVIEYTPEAEALIKNALVRKDSNTVNKGATPVQKPLSQDTQSADPAKGGMSINTRIQSIQSGTQVLKAIEMIIRNSSYITDQANVVYDEETNLPRPNKKIKGKNPGFKWFNVITKAEKLGDDSKTNDYAYRITYIISVYNVAFLMSPYFPPGAFPGLHKRYQYWFTGQNTAVLDYKETFNYQYQITNSGSPDDDSIKKRFDRTMTNSMVVIPYVTIAARTSQSSQGAQNRANDLAASAAEDLYNPADLGSSKITIIGDPAWIMQGSILNAGLASMYDSRGFNDDGSINFDTGQVLYEIVWQKPEDFDLMTGLADPYSRTEKLYKTRQALQSRVYIAATVTNYFRGGTFTQELEGVTMINPIPIDKQTLEKADEFDQQNQAQENQASPDGATDQADQRETTGTGDQRSPLPSVVIPSGTNILGGVAVSGSPISTNLDLLNSARMQNTAGGVSALLIPAATRLSTLAPTIGIPTVAEMVNIAVANAAPVSATLQRAPAALPVISNGQVVGTAQPATGNNTQPVLSDPQNMSRET